MSHFLIVADESMEPAQLDGWRARCACGWSGTTTTEDAADAEAEAHRAEGR
jgi:hypothetical protein